MLEQRAQPKQHATRVRNTRELFCIITTSIQYKNTTKGEYECKNVKLNNLLYSNRKIYALLNTVHNAMQITFRAKTEVHDESHRVLERKICEFFVVFESVNQLFAHATSNESGLYQRPAQEFS